MTADGQKTPGFLTGENETPDKLAIVSVTIKEDEPNDRP